MSINITNQFETDLKINKISVNDYENAVASGGITKDMIDKEVFLFTDLTQRLSQSGGGTAEPSGVEPSYFRDWIDDLSQFGVDSYVYNTPNVIDDLAQNSSYVYSHNIAIQYLLNAKIRLGHHIGRYLNNFIDLSSDLEKLETFEQVIESNLLPSILSENSILSTICNSREAREKIKLNESVYNTFLTNDLYAAKFIVGAAGFNTTPYLSIQDMMDDKKLMKSIAFNDDCISIISKSDIASRAVFNDVDTRNIILRNKLNAPIIADSYIAMNEIYQTLETSDAMMRHFLSNDLAIEKFMSNNLVMTLLVESRWTNTIDNMTDSVSMMNKIVVSKIVRDAIKRNDTPAYAVTYDKQLVVAKISAYELNIANYEEYNSGNDFANQVDFSLLLRDNSVFSFSCQSPNFITPIVFNNELMEYMITTKELFDIALGKIEFVDVMARNEVLVRRMEQDEAVYNYINANFELAFDTLFYIEPVFGTGELGDYVISGDKSTWPAADSLGRLVFNTRDCTLPAGVTIDISGTTDYPGGVWILARGNVLIEGSIITTNSGSCSTIPSEYPTSLTIKGVAHSLGVGGTATSGGTGGASGTSKYGAHTSPSNAGGSIGIKRANGTMQGQVQGGGTGGVGGWSLSNQSNQGSAGVNNFHPYNASTAILILARRRTTIGLASELVTIGMAGSPASSGVDASGTVNGKQFAGNGGDGCVPPTAGGPINILSSRIINNGTLNSVPGPSTESVSAYTGGDSFFSLEQNSTGGAPGDGRSASATAGEIKIVEGAW